MNYVNTGLTGHHWNWTPFLPGAPDALTTGKASTQSSRMLPENHPAFTKHQASSMKHCEMKKLTVDASFRNELIKELLSIVSEWMDELCQLWESLVHLLGIDRDQFNTSAIFCCFIWNLQGLWLGQITRSWSRILMDCTFARFVWPIGQCPPFHCFPHCHVA